METQYQWEQEAYAYGMEKFFNDEEQARYSGKMDETAVGSSIIKQRVLDVAAELEVSATRKTRGIGGAYSQALRVAATRHDGKEFYQDYNIPAYVGLVTLLQRAYVKVNTARYLTEAATEIGRRLEFDQKLYVFRQDNKAFVGKIEQSLAQQGVTSLEHKIKTYQKKWRDAEMKWSDWSNVQRTQVGIRVIRAIMTAMDDCFVLTKKHDGKYLRHYIDTTIELDDFVIRETDAMSMTMPRMQPTVEPPMQWTRVNSAVIGGYHTPELRRVAPFIKTKGEEHKAFVESAYPYKHIQAVNHMQATAWKINNPILELVKTAVQSNWEGFGLPRKDNIDIPEHPGDDASDEDKTLWMVDAKRIHGINKQNTSALIVLSQSLQMADRLADRDFWHVYTCDFRGRIYCASTMMSTQGADHIKALATFSEGKPLGREGIRWLAINGANKYGYDKVDYNDRVRWVMAQREGIEAVVSDPGSSRSRSFLSGADKPFQFAAFCFEWAACGFGTDPDFVSHLPIGLDGSCNGLQHYGALLRDPRGGLSVNLTDGELPNDVYGDVAAEFRRLLSLRSGDPMAAQLLQLQPDRKATKRPVMTLPYGSTQQSCRNYLMDWLEDKLGTGERKSLWPLAVYATPVMWEAIGNVVIAARAAMDWLQTCSSMVAAKGKFAHWLSPADFPVYQHYAERETVKIETDLLGRITVNLEGGIVSVNRFRARNGVSPNFIHAMDASHMVMAINEAKGRGLTSMAMIHDDFGVHACDIPEFNDVIRITFVRMYYDRDWLQVWKREIERIDEDLELPEPPAMGDLDVLQVLDSKYFFG